MKYNIKYYLKVINKMHKNSAIQGNSMTIKGLKMLYLC